MRGIWQHRVQLRNNFNFKPITKTIIDNLGNKKVIFYNLDLIFVNWAMTHFGCDAILFDTIIIETGG